MPYIRGRGVLMRGDDGTCCVCVSCVFFFQAEDGIRDLVRSRGLGDVYKRQGLQEGLPDRAQALAPNRRDVEHRRKLEKRQPALDLSLIHI